MDMATPDDQPEIDIPQITLGKKTSGYGMGRRRSFLRFFGSRLGNLFSFYWSALSISLGTLLVKPETRWWRRQRPVPGICGEMHDESFTL